MAFSANAYYQKHRTKILQQRKAYLQKHPRKVKDGKLRGQYGISLEQYEQMLFDQNGVCAICHQPERMVWRGKIRALVVDHDHVTGKVRQLLCKRCNSILGFVKDQSLLLRVAAEYLERHGIR